MRRLIERINRWFERMEPHRIFHESTYHYKLHKKPRIGAGIFGGTEYGSSWTSYDYTKLGNFVNKLPILPELFIKLVYYCITWPLHCCVRIPWILFRVIFIPSSWL